MIVKKIFLVLHKELRNILGRTTRLNLMESLSESGRPQLTTVRQTRVNAEEFLCILLVPWVTPCNYLNLLQSQQTEEGGECEHRVSCLLTAVHRWTWLSAWKLTNYCWVLIRRTISWLLNQGLECDSCTSMDDEGHWHRQRQAKFQLLPFNDLRQWIASIFGSDCWQFLPLLPDYAKSRGNWETEEEAHHRIWR